MKAANNPRTIHVYYIIALIAGALIIGSLVVGLLVQRNPLIQQFDQEVYGLIHRGPHPGWLDALVRPVNFNILPIFPLHLPVYTYLMALFLIAYLWLRNRPMLKWALLCLLVGFVLSRAISLLNWEFAFRYRPFFSLPSRIDEYGISVWSKFSSYPSGHARDTALYSAIIAAFIPRLRWALLAFTLFVAFSRVYVGAHYPTDVIAGVIIGYLSAKVGIMLSHEMQELRKRRVPQDEDLAPVAQEI